MYPNGLRGTILLSNLWNPSSSTMAAIISISKHEKYSIRFKVLTRPYTSFVRIYHFHITSSITLSTSQLVLDEDCSNYLAEVTSGVLSHIFFEGFLVTSMVGSPSAEEVIRRPCTSNFNKNPIARSELLSSFISQMCITLRRIQGKQMNCFLHHSNNMHHALTYRLLIYPIQTKAQT